MIKSKLEICFKVECDENGCWKKGGLSLNFKGCFKKWWYE